MKRPQTEFRASSPVPSIQVEQVLRQRLRRECQPGDRFPTEHVLCEEFRVSRTLIRSVLARLVEEGLLKRKSRLGRVAAAHRDASQDPLLSDLIDHLHDYRANTKVQCLDIATAVVATGMRQRLKLDNAEPITVIRRRVTMDENPISYMVSFLPQTLGAQLSKQTVERQPLARLLTQQLGVTIRNAMQTVEPVVADIETARYLDVAVGAPLLLVERDFLGRGNKPIYHTQQFCRGDRYKFSTTLQWKLPVSRSRDRKKAQR